MTVKELQNRINTFVEAHPDLLNEHLVVDGEWLCIADYDEDDDKWNFGETLTILPENTKAEYN